MDKKEVGTMMQSAAKVPISDLNECITCKLCRGYFIDATTIIECLHTFCRSCIVRYLETNKYCPICDVQVHKTKPLLNIRQDKTIQNLVYKLVPRLYQNEVQKRKAYYEAHPESKPTLFEEGAATQFEYLLAPEECVNVTLNYFGSKSTPRYLRCPSAVSVNHLKKLIRSKYELTDHNRVDVYYDQDCLNPSFSLMDILYIYSRKRKDPLDLTYKIYECRAKKPKLDAASNCANNSTNNNNNNWKEVQLRISENGEMSITGIEDANMMALLDATENYKSDIVMNEGKNLEVADNKSVETSSGDVKVDRPACMVEEQSIGTISMSSCTTSTSNSTKTPISSTRTSNSDPKVVNSSSIAKSPKKPNLDTKKTSSELPNNTTETQNNIRKHPRITVDQKQLRNISEQQLRNISELPKNVEISDTLNLNSELSVIPLSTSVGCVSLSACAETTTVFSTISKTMCSTKLDGGGVGGYGEARSVLGGCDSKKLFSETEKEPIKNSNLKENKNLKRKHEEDVKNPEVPQKLPKPTILNHSIGLMNLSNNHPLKKHPKINRNGEHPLRTAELKEKVPISTQNLTVNHVSVPQKSISIETNPSKPIIINKNVSNLQITRPGTPKSGQRGGQGGNVPCYANKTAYNSVGGVNKAAGGEKNGGDKVESTQGKTEVSTSQVNSTIKPSIHHAQTYHTPIITPSQLPHHQNLNSLQLKPLVNSVQDKVDQRSYQSNLTSQGSTVMSQAASQVHTVTSQSKPSVATSQPIIHPSNKSSTQAAPHPTPSNHQVHASTSSSAPSSIQNTPPTQTQPTPTAIKTKPSTPIGYKTLRDPPKSWNSQINSQIARVNQNVKAQQLANAVAAAASQVGGANAQGGRFAGDLKSVRPAKFFKGRNMPRYLGCPASGVKPMYQLQGSSDKEKGQEQQQSTAAPAQAPKQEKSEIKKHSIVKIDPKTLRPISEKAPETSNLSTPSSLGLSVSQNSQELRIHSSTGDLKINTSSVSIFNPLKLQSSPKSERKSPKSPHSPKVKNSPNSSIASSTNTTSISPSPSNTLSPKQHRDKTSLTFTPPNPFVPNLASPTLSPNQFLYPAGGFPNYDPRFMAAYHSLLYSQRMAAAGFVPPPMPHAFGMNMGLNTATTTMTQQQLSPRISLKHSTSPKSSGQASPRSTNATTSTQISKSSPTRPPTPNKKTKESSLSAKIDKSLETALNKLSQGKAKEVGGAKPAGGTAKQVGGNSKKKETNVVQQRPSVSTPIVDSHLGLTFMGGNSFAPPPTSHQEVGGGTTMSALEKLSQNKAIEIMGGGGGGKRSPAVLERDGRSSPMGGHKRDVVGGKGSPSRGRASPRLQMAETISKNDTPKRQQSPLTTDSKKPTPQPPSQLSDPSKTSEKSLPNNQNRPQHSEKKLEENKPIIQNCLSSEANTASSELQTRLAPPIKAQKSSDNAEVTQVQSTIGSDQKEESKKGSNQNRSDQSRDRLDQNQNMSEKSQSGSEIREPKKIEVDNGSSCTGDSKKVTPSPSDNKTVSVGEILDNSDIKATNSEISGKKTNTDNAVTDKPAGNAANDVVSGETTTTTIGNVTESDESATGGAGNAAKSDVPVTDRAGNGATERSSGEVGEKESDKGGGEKKE